MNGHTESEVEAVQSDAHDELADHPSPRKYVFIGIVLAIITAIEVAIFYIEMPTGLLVTSLIVLSLGKFGLVVAWFMHLKFDSRLFRFLFVTGLVFALSLFAIVLVLFASNDGPAPTITGG